VTPLITGIGLCTPLGNTAASTWRSLCAGRFITDHARVPDVDSHLEPRVSALALRAAREAVAEAGWSEKLLTGAALIVGTSKGPVDDWLGRADAPRENEQLAPCLGLAETAVTVATELTIHGPRLTLSAACASGLLALIRAAIMIRAGEVKRALVVATESSLHPLFLASFKRLGVLSPPGHGCRPFDKNRAGFVVSEAAAAVCLEAPGVQPVDSSPLAIDRFAMGADATHLTGVDADGVALRHLLRPLFHNRQFDLIHAHGTATRANDPIELAAIESHLNDSQENPPTLYSHKAALGHSLGASGLISIALNCLSHRHGIIPPNILSREAIPTQAVEINPRLTLRPVRTSLCIAAGFGGSMAALSIMSNA
jgi:3-oxoacyl-[acyl-carrier-protein] synthase II